jgi:hypothetical protein
MARTSAAAVVVVALAMAGCDGPPGLQAAVKRQLRDPASARFLDIHRCPGTRIYSGEVNAKNAFGGYAGSEPFYYADGYAVLLSGADDATFIRLAELCKAAAEAQLSALQKLSGPPTSEGR